MRVLVISQYFYPEQFQINEILPELVSLGYDVTVLTGLPNYPAGELYNDYEYRKYKDEYKGVKIIRVKERPRKKGKINLFLNYLSFLTKGIYEIYKLKEKYDLVYIYQLSPITSAIPGILYSRKHKVPCILYCLDIWPESALSLLNNKKGHIYHFLKLVSKKVYDNCNNVIVTSHPFIEYLVETHNVSESKIKYIPQHADSSYLQKNLLKKMNGRIDFMYAGNLGNGQVIHNIILATEQLINERDFHVHIVGDGSQYKHLKEMVEEKELNKYITFYGNQKREDMESFYKQTDALLLTLRGNNLVGNTMPGKLQMYMTTGKPIFGAVNGAANEVIKISNCGEVTEAGDYIGLSQIMRKYIHNPELYKSCGKNAQKYFGDNFTLERYISQLDELLREYEKDKYEI